MNLDDFLGTDREPERIMCSRKGCSEDAGYRIEWNNPKIHTPERRKVWLACPEHRDWLADFLKARGFLKDVVPFEPRTN